MSRSFSIAGLPKEFAVISKKLKLKVVGKQSFKEYFYSDGYEFKVYQDPNGIRYEEFEAGCPWNGGPELFLGLRNCSTKEIICSWTPSQMGFSEEVYLPEQYTEELSKVHSLFVTEENEEFVKGYCPLYVHISDSSIDIFQSRTSKFPKVDVLTVKIRNSSDGGTIRDWLTQEGFSMEELSVSAQEYIRSREEYLSKQK